MQISLFDSIQGINVLPYDGEALFFPGFLTDEESDFYMSQLLKDYEFKQLKIKIYDKEVLQPKLTAFCGEPGEGLEYSEETLPIQPWSRSLQRLREKVEERSETKFTHALLNLYRDGKDGVGWHRDKERHWGREPVIASVSLGASRMFQFRSYTEKNITRSIELTTGSLLIMKGVTNDRWEHRIAKTTKRIGPRLNITFRVKKQE